MIKLKENNYYYIYEISDSLQTTEDAFQEINEPELENEMYYGKYKTFKVRYNVFTDVIYLKNNQPFKDRSFSIINNIFLEKEKEVDSCCMILDGRRKSNRIKVVTGKDVKKKRSKKQSKKRSKKQSKKRADV